MARKKLSPEEKAAKKAKRQARASAAEKLEKKGMELKPYTIVLNRNEENKHMVIRISEVPDFRFFLSTYEQTPRFWTLMSVANTMKHSYNGRSVKDRLGDSDSVNEEVSLSIQEWGAVPADIISLIRKAIKKHVVKVKDDSGWSLSNEQRYGVPIMAFEKIRSEIEGTHMARQKKTRNARRKEETVVDAESEE